MTWVEWSNLRIWLSCRRDGIYNPGLPVNGVCRRRDRYRKRSPRSGDGENRYRPRNFTTRRPRAGRLWMSCVADSSLVMRTVRDSSKGLVSADRRAGGGLRSRRIAPAASIHSRLAVRADVPAEGLDETTAVTGDEGRQRISQDCRVNHLSGEWSKRSARRFSRRGLGYMSAPLSIVIRGIEDGSPRLGFHVKRFRQPTRYLYGSRRRATAAPPGRTVPPRVAGARLKGSAAACACWSPGTWATSVRS